MVSPELLRRYPFFAGLTHDHIVTMANAAAEQAVEAGNAFFRADEAMCCLYLTIEGAVGVVMELPDHTVEQSLSGQLTGALHTRDVVMRTVGPGEVFGWSALVPPYTSTASAKALAGSSRSTAPSCARASTRIAVSPS